MIRLAHATSVVSVEGWHTKIRRRLGVSPGPVALYGPLIVTLATAGSGPRPRKRGRTVSSSRASVCSRNVTPRSRGPDFNGKRTSRFLLAPRPPRPVPRPACAPPWRPPAEASPIVSSCRRSPSAVTSIWCGSFTAPASSILMAYSPSSGSVVWMAVPPRVPYGRSSMRPSCGRCPGRR